MMSSENLIHALFGNYAGRTPFILPGGLISSCAADGERVLLDTPHRIAGASAAIRRKYGLDCAGLPCVMTVESEFYGGESEGKSDYDYPLTRVADWRGLASPDISKDARFPLVAEAVRLIKDSSGGAAVMADLVMPPSLASSLVDARELLKAMAARPEDVRGFLDFLAGNSIKYMERLAGAGADAFFAVDPFSTANTLGAGFFKDFSLYYINEFVSAAKRLGCPFIIHLCGDIRLLAPALSGVEASCVSIDADITTGEARRFFPEGIKMMGSGAMGKCPDVLSVSCGMALDLSGWI